VSATATLDASTFAALGEPNRLRIVELLRGGPLPVGAIAERLELRQPQVSKHLRVLGESRIVEAEVQHRYRIYQLCPEQFDAVARWVDSFEVLWDTRLDALGALLHAIDSEGDHLGHQADR
jgi:DNA-binding transcriptional ArsR family regulator